MGKRAEGGRAVVWRERGSTVLERGRASWSVRMCVVVVREHGKVGGSGRTVVWRERGSVPRGVWRALRRRMRALLINASQRARSHRLDKRIPTRLLSRALLKSTYRC